MEGTPRFQQHRHDLQQAGDLLSSIDPLVSINQISDCFRLGKFQPTKSRPLLVKLTRSSDVQSILMQRNKLSSKPSNAIKPDKSPEERKVESLLLKERRSLIDAGVERSSIRIKGNSIFVNKHKYGVISDSSFQKCPPVSDQYDHTIDLTSSQTPVDVSPQSLISPDDHNTSSEPTDSSN